MTRRLDRLPAAAPGRTARVLWAATIATLVAGIALWAAPGLVTGIVALWAFCAVAVGLCLVLPLTAAVVAPLFLGILGWTVDMLPLLILIGWTTVVLRWIYSLWTERRLPRARKWFWLAFFLLFWTGTGIIVITSADFRHFLLLAGVQFIISALLVMIVDRFGGLEERESLAVGLVSFVIVLSVAVFLQWIGVPVESLQDQAPRRRVEAAYGLDAFPNAIGMIKYARATRSGAGELRSALSGFAEANPDLPAYEAFRPRFQAYENRLVVTFQGSARPFAAELEQRFNIELLYDNVGLAPAITVPRLRSFPRNALTYAGTCVAVLPFAFYLAWTGRARRRWLGWAGVASCLFGAAFSLARGAWAAIAIGVVYLAIDGQVSWKRKLQTAAAVLGAAAVLTTTFFIKYGVDPVTGRLGGGASVATREELYQETLDFVQGKYLAFGYGTEKPRTESGTVHEDGRYVPRAGTHSTYLNYLFRTGVPGALAIMAVYLTAGLHARAAARASAGRERVFRSLTAMSIASVGAHAVILSLYVEPTYTLTVSLVLAMAVAGALNMRTSVWRLWRFDEGSTA